MPPSTLIAPAIVLSNAPERCIAVAEWFAATRKFNTTSAVTSRRAETGHKEAPGPLPGNDTAPNRAALAYFYDSSAASKRASDAVTPGSPLQRRRQLLLTQPTRTFAEQRTPVDSLDAALTARSRERRFCTLQLR